MELGIRDTRRCLEKVIEEGRRDYLIISIIMTVGTADKINLLLASFFLKTLKRRVMNLRLAQ